MELENKKNCWEYFQCGRHPGGERVREFGVCPVFDEQYSGINDGLYAGRICWAVAGSFCGRVRQGVKAKARFTCMCCPFFKAVKKEENNNFHLLVPHTKRRCLR